MRLTLAYHPLTDVRFGASTQLEGTVLEIFRRRATSVSPRRSPSSRGVALAIVHPGEACRFGVVFDILEPRAKAPGALRDFPGIFNPIAMIFGEGITHVLQGAAVRVLDAGSACGRRPDC